MRSVGPMLGPCLFAVCEASREAGDKIEECELTTMRQPRAIKWNTHFSELLFGKCSILLE